MRIKATSKPRTKPSFGGPSARDPRASVRRLTIPAPNVSELLCDAAACKSVPLVVLNQVATERPPEGLARGKYPAPPWVIAVLAIAVALGAILTLVIRARRARKRRP